MKKYADVSKVVFDPKGTDPFTFRWYGPDEVAAQAMKDLKKKKTVSILGHPVRRQVRLVKLLPVELVMDIWCRQQGIK